MTPFIHALAVRQLADLRARRPGTFFATPDATALTLEEAYAVAAEVAELRRAAGEPLAGYKVGCTGPGVRAQFGMDGPICGHVFATELHAGVATVSASDYEHLAIEGELAVWLDADATIARVLPVIELHDFVFRGPRPTLVELVANNGLHRGAVLGGEGVPWRGGEPLAGDLLVEIDGTLQARGSAAGVPGGPEGSLDWLRGHLGRRSAALAPGQLVLTGTPLGLYPVRVGQCVRVVLEGFGEATLHVRP